MTHFRRPALALALVLASTSIASADTPADAWAAAKPHLDAKTQVIVGADLAAIKTTQAFQQFVPKAIDGKPELKAGLATIKSECGIDAMDALQGIVVAMANADQKTGVIFVSTKGITSASAIDCLGKIAKKENPKATITASKPDKLGIVELKSSTEKDSIYLAFMPKGVIAMATEPKDKAMLTAALKGKGIKASTEVGKLLGTVDSKAAFWMVGAKTQSMGGVATMKALSASLALASGVFTANVRVTLASAKEATSMADMATKQLAQMGGAGLPPPIADAMKTVKVTAAGADIVATGSITEKALMAMVNMAAGMGLGGMAH